jgi:hypothetical protein
MPSDRVDEPVADVREDMVFHRCQPFPLIAFRVWNRRIDIHRHFPEVRHICDPLLLVSSRMMFSPFRARARRLTASTRASASDTTGNPPRPIVHAQPHTSVRRIHEREPLCCTSRQRPLPSACRPGGRCGSFFTSNRLTFRFAIPSNPPTSFLETE